MKRDLKVIIMLVAVITSLAFAGIAVSASGLYIDNNCLKVSTGGYTFIKETNIGVVTSIRIDVATADVRFIKADKYGFEIRYQEAGAGFNYSLKNGVLVIEQRNEFKISLLSLLLNRDYVYVYLPENAMLEAADIINCSGTISIERLSCAKLFIKQASGCVDISNLKADDATVKSTSGKVTVIDGAAKYFDFFLTSGSLVADGLDSKGLRAELISGKVDLKGSFTGNTTLYCTTGTVRLCINGAEKDYNRNISVLVGSILVNNKKVGAGNVHYKADNMLDIKTITGNVEIIYQK